MKSIFVMMCVLVLSGCEMSVNAEFSPSKEYCDMWQVWHESGGEYGYPDPNNVYEKECINDDS